LSTAETPFVVLDTNVVLDWLVFDDVAVQPLAQALTEGRLRWVATPAMLDEFSHVLHRPGLERWLARRQQALTFAAASAERADMAPLPPARALRCDDPDDQKFIDLALAWPARWLITRDKALLRLARAAAPLGTTVCLPSTWA
jgi:putative PIN family toxin of toxin-antitoxin system